MIENKNWVKYFGELEEVMITWSHKLRTSNQRIVFIKNHVKYFAKTE